jgi:colicin import membrane protein
MPRRLKTYQISIGFFDLAIAAPSMKAAAEAWGSDTDVFKKGFAKETDDPEIVAATMAKPGVLLRRPVGSNDLFSENAELPQIDKVTEKRTKSQSKRGKPKAHKVDHEAAKDAALAFQREQKRRDSERRKEEARREKRRKRQEQAIAKAARTLEQAERAHAAEMKKIEKDRTAVDKRSRTEDARWRRQKEKLEAALRRARD